MHPRVFLRLWRSELLIGLCRTHRYCNLSRFRNHPIKSIMLSPVLAVFHCCWLHFMELKGNIFPLSKDISAVVFKSSRIHTHTHACSRVHALADLNTHGDAGISCRRWAAGCLWDWKAPVPTACKHPADRQTLPCIYAKSFHEEGKQYKHSLSSLNHRSAIKESNVRP